MAVRNLLATFALALALGAIVAGQLLIFPNIDGSGPLADANLARALRAPLELRLATLTAVYTAAASVCLLNHTDGKLPLTLTLAALTALVLNRAWILPELHSISQRVDLVTQLPAPRMERVQAWTLRYQMVDAIAAIAIAAALLLRETLALRSLRAISSLTKPRDT